MQNQTSKKQSKISTRDIIDKLRSNDNKIDKINISQEVYDILCSKDDNKKVALISQDNFIIEDLLFEGSENSMLLIKRFIKMGWNGLLIILNQITQDNPFMALQILGNSKFKKLYYSTYRSNNGELNNISRKAKRKIEKIIYLSEKYEKSLI